ncbi:MAG: error-prone DNA polymerase [Alphaproteobacteria bacterium]|nr:error-prone DNA polymerase [Alphaproteobacteria bacterium]
MPAYAELQVTSNFSFLRGASHPAELARRAAELGHAAMAITDRNSLAGIVRAHKAAREVGLRLIVGCRLDLTRNSAASEPDGPSLLCLPTDRAAYGRLTQLLTLGKRRTVKGQCRLGLDDLLAHGAGQIFVALPPSAADAGFPDLLRQLQDAVAGRLYLAAHCLHGGDDGRRLAWLQRLASQVGVPLVATNDVHAHVPERRPLLDVLTCIRHHTSVDKAGWLLTANAERHLKPAGEMARLFARYPDTLARTIEIADRCRFNLDELRYEYPAEAMVPGETAQRSLERLTREALAERYPDGPPDKVAGTLRHELALIAALGYAPYFLTVHDIVCFARSQGILCQGRGSAANSVVCYLLGITAVDPTRIDLLFERFISAARNEPPDIDVDFEHERREEVIQYIYEKYGRARAGLTATVITYRSRSALRDVGKALGLSLDTVGLLAGNVWGWGRTGIDENQVRELGLDPADRRLDLALTLTRELVGFPRHLSQHVGGFVITRGRLDALVPIENAAMVDRTVIEWDKDDIDTLGILKVDVLGLGMLTCIRKGFEILALHYDVHHGLASVPSDDPAVYDMLCRADSIGVFQVESRAQMSMLPRLKPRNFYDLVIEVAIVRPGPIQGDMVHPYLRRRQGKEPVAYPSKELEAVLGKTLGVPLFQEQAMRIAIVAAGFTPDEADQLRRSMATFRHDGDIHRFGHKMVAGMVAKGYPRDFAERCFHQIEGFGTYGFPESHAAAFAHLVYISAWLKCHYPAVFACALLNCQPMGFYAPAQIVGDAVDHGIEVRPADVNSSDWDCTLEPPAAGAGHALRLGFRQIKGFSEADANRLVLCRGAGYATPEDVQRRAGLTAPVLRTLARADAFASIGCTRRQALWASQRPANRPLPLFAWSEPGTEQGSEPAITLSPASLGEEVARDYRTTGLSLKRHPLVFLRAWLARQGVTPHARLADVAPGRRVKVAGLVLVRQRPGSANGVIFTTLEDETGIANLIVWPAVFERLRRPLLQARLLLAEGPLQREGIVIHVVVERLADLSRRLDGIASPVTEDPLASYDPLPVRSRNFH